MSSNFTVWETAGESKMWQVQECYLGKTMKATTSEETTLRIQQENVWMNMILVRLWKRNQDIQLTRV